MKKILLIIAALAIVCSPALTLAQTTPQAQVDEIKALTDQIKALQAERQTKVSTLITMLKRGALGDSVKTLQQLLALDPAVYPEALVTGYYGPLTTKAVKRFQKQNGLPQVGVVGPLTVEKLKKLAETSGLTIDEDTATNVPGQAGKLCAIIPPGHLIAPGQLKKAPRPQIPECQILPPGIKAKIDGIVAPQPDPEDKVAPTISGLGSTDVTSTSAKIAWTTNEAAKSKIWVSTTNPVVTTGTPTQEKTTFGTAHAFALTELTPSTAYYYVVSSVDASGNVVVSSQGTFTTLAVDNTAPTISGLGSTDVTSTSAKIAWTTNEAAKSKIWVSTTNPVVTTGTPTQEKNDMLTTHTFSLTGLSGATTYYYIVTSTDAANNTATSTQGTFTTSL